MRTLRRWGSSICRVGPGWSARACPDREYPGPPDAGNLHVRWDEGEGSRVRPCSLSTLLVSLRPPMDSRRVWAHAWYVLATHSSYGRSDHDDRPRSVHEEKSNGSFRQGEERWA